MYDLRPYAELKIEEVTPASIMYKLESIHRRLNESYNQIAACRSQNGSSSTGRTAGKVAMVNGGECATVSHCNGSATDAEVADIAARQENVIKRIEQLRAKLDSLLVAQKSGDAKQSSANEKSKNKGDKKEKGKGKGGPVEAQKSDGGAPTIGLLLRAPAEAQSVAPPKGQSIAACAPPTLLDFGNSSASVAEILSAEKKIDVTLSIGADDVYWASALLNALTSRQKDVSVRSFKHSTHGGTALPALTTLAFNESAPISVTVVIKANDDVGPSVSLGSRKHGPVVGWMAVWKLLGRLGGLYPTETGAFADTATRMDFWLAKAMTLARGDEKTKEVTAREMSAFLGRCDFLGAVDGLSLTDVVVYGLLCRNDKNASNLESWLDRCRAVGVKACCC